MVKLIVGTRGSGKTKTLIEQINAAGKTSKGNVVCIEKGDSLKFDVNYKIRLIDMEAYDAFGVEAYYGFIAGLLAGNYDITEIFGDATLKILGGKDDHKDIDALAEFVEKVEALATKTGTSVTFTVSCDKNDLPENIQKYII